MSFFDDASLAFLPSGAAGKDGKAYSIKPTDGTGDFTFSRGSNLAATRVGADGLIEKGRENLLLQSNQFDTTWNVLNAPTLTSGQTGYDGSSDAWLFESTTSSTAVINQNVSSSGVQTISLYAKAGTADYLVFYNSAANYAFFNLSSGSVGSTSGIIDTSIESIGSGWYRCSMTYTASISYMRIYVADANAVFNSAVGSNIYIQDAQLEIGLAATDYIESGATTGKAGLLEDEPRFDYSGGATCPSLLLEPSRTQLVHYSEAISQWDSNLNSPVVTANFATSPEGLTNATKLTFPGPSDAVSDIYTGIATGTNLVFSSYVKNIDATSTTIQIRNSVTDFQSQVNWTGSQITSVTTINGTLEYEAVGNDWYRIWGAYTSTDGLQRPRFYGGGSNASYLAYGVQLEEASYPTSYIPNHSGGSVTRGGDLISKDLTSVVNGNEITMFLDLKSHISIERRTIDIWGDLRWYHKSSNRILFYKQDDAINVSGDIVVDTRTKIALSITTTEVKVFVNGSQYGSATSLPTPFVNFGQFTYNINDSKEEWNQFLIFSTPLSDADCITLTTL